MREKGTSVSVRRRATARHTARSNRAPVATQLPAPKPPLVAERYFYPLAAVLLLIPCFWQSRLQAGDLSSHIYNAWLAQRIQAGGLGGLAIVRQTTNILFDVMLSHLLAWFGAGAAQKIAVAAAVLIFASGAFAFAAAVSGRRPWNLLPAIAMLSYGWVFQMGFFNFYLSLGLCLWALGLAWNGGRARLAGAAALLLAAWPAHMLPVLWSAGVLAFVWFARRRAWRWRVWLFAGYTAALFFVHFVVVHMVYSTWNQRQFLLVTGADQAWIFDDKYHLTFAGLLICWAALFITLAFQSGLRPVLTSLPFQLCVLNAAAVIILPTEAHGLGLAASFIADRLSLCIAVCACALLAAAKPGVVQRFALAAVALLFFGFLYRDDRLLNSLEDRMEQAVAQLPPGQRVVDAVNDYTLHVTAVTHMIDRVCVGRCYSYGNYEPPSAMFRIRVRAPNRAVAATDVDSWRMQNGGYVVKPEDVPLYEVDLDASGQLVARSLKAGESTQHTDLKALPDLF